MFLDASSHLYKRVCPSVRPSVRRSVGPSVRRAVTPSQNEPFVRKKFKIPSSAHQRTLSASIRKQKATKISLSLLHIHSHARAHTYANNNHDADIVDVLTTSLFGANWFVMGYARFRPLCINGRPIFPFLNLENSLLSKWKQANIFLTSVGIFL